MKDNNAYMIIMICDKKKVIVIGYNNLLWFNNK